MLRPSKTKNLEISEISRPYNLAEQIRKNTCDICRIEKYFVNIEKQIIKLIEKDIDLQNQINDIVIGSSSTSVVKVDDPTTESISGNLENDTQQEINQENATAINNLTNTLQTYQTQVLPVSSPTTESISGTATNQRIINEEVVTEIGKIENGEIDFPALSLNGDIITSWPSGEGAEYSEELLITSSTTESVSGEATNQRIVNEEVVTEINKIENGEINYPQLILNGITIESWPNGGASNSSEITDDSDTNPTEGINPWKTQINSNTNDIANIETEIENIENGTTPIPQNTDNVIYTVLNNSTTEALGNFTEANPRLYGDSTNDTVVRDNILLSYVDNLQEQIDEINNGSSPISILDDIISSKEPPVTGDLVTEGKNLSDYNFLLFKSLEDNESNYFGILDGTNLIYDNTTLYRIGSDNYNSDDRIWMKATGDTNLNISIEASRFNGLIWIKGTNFVYTPLLDADGDFQDGDVITLNQDLSTFKYLFFKTLINDSPDSYSYAFLNVDTLINQTSNRVDYNGYHTLINYVDNLNVNVESVQSANHVINVWGVNPANLEDLTEVEFNPNDYDLLFVTSHLVTQNVRDCVVMNGSDLVLDSSTKYTATKVYSRYFYTASETGLTPNSDTEIIKIEGIKVTNNCTQKASECEMVALEARVSALENLNSSLNKTNLNLKNKIEELELKIEEIERY